MNCANEVGKRKYNFPQLKSDVFFYVLDDGLHNFLYCPLPAEHFHYRRVSVFPFHDLSFRFRLTTGNPNLPICKLKLKNYSV